MDIALKEIHIGEAIAKRVSDLGIPKGEFARRACIPQQHVYRVFDRDTIEVKKLIRICKVLDFNFFSLFCEQNNSLPDLLSSLNFDDNSASETKLTPEAVATQFIVYRSRYEDAQKQIQILDKLTTQMTSQLEDKERLLQVMYEQVESLKEKIARLGDENATLKK